MATYDQVFQLALKLDMVEGLRYIKEFRETCILSRNQSNFSKKNALPAFVKEYGKYRKLTTRAVIIPATEVPFNKVPLLMTNKSPYVKTVASWRLLVGE
jgi:hypothetical protein